ncbi:hypothetical protein [Butyricimonas hominis]|uniref:Lipoprotein n=2 Tax=Odoribacteraceae TaxID=1853231 RepID=A0ABR7D6R2_9BACT|nr:hypothetical protein [Butyricimonas hominis]MBC5623479.1 hypothetical protein [Butyricimonas hominis]
MKNLIGILLLSLFALASCHDDENGTLSPSNVDVDWYVIKDNPNDELDHLIYEIYSKYKVPVYYNDTIGREYRGLDANGDSIIYYKTLMLGYSIEQNVTSMKYTLSEQRQDILEGVKFLEEYVIPFQQKGMKPRCFLLVEDLIFSSDQIDLYYGMSGAVVSRVAELKEMTREDKEAFGLRIRGSEWAHALVNNYSKELEYFYGLSSVVGEDGKVTDMHLQDVQQSSSSLFPWKDKKYYGFLSVDEEGEKYVMFQGFVKYYRCPTENADLLDFVMEVLKDDWDVFQAEYSDCPIILDKYEYLKKLMESVRDELVEKNN